MATYESQWRTDIFRILYILGLWKTGNEEVYEKDGRVERLYGIVYVQSGDTETRNQTFFF